MVTDTAGVPAFHHATRGTPASSWLAAPGRGLAEPLSLAGVERLVVLAAHPDDESLGAGGLVASATDHGIPVTVVCATDGERSHPASPTLTPEHLARIRGDEGRAALLELGVGQHHLVRLRLPDGDLAEHEAALTTALVQQVATGPGTVVVAPWREDGHPDHEAAGRAAAAACRRTDATLWEYPVWFWHWASPDTAPWHRLRPWALDEHARQAKAHAVRAHRSQVAPLSDLPGDEAVVGPEMLARAADPVERYVVTPAEDCPDDALDQVHLREPDPWGASRRWYEERKRDLVLAALPRKRHGRALEVGCSVGDLAAALRERVDSLVAVDRSPAAVRGARERLGDHVDVRLLDVPSEWPEGRFDLAVVSEVGYFLSPASLDRLVARLDACLEPTGALVLCHWRHPVEGWALDGSQVHERVAARLALPLQATYTDRDVEVRVHAADGTWPDPYL